jgi:hypothetical protein
VAVPCAKHSPHAPHANSVEEQVLAEEQRVPAAQQLFALPAREHLLLDQFREALVQPTFGGPLFESGQLLRLEQTRRPQGV